MLLRLNWKHSNFRDSEIPDSELKKFQLLKWKDSIFWNLQIYHHWTSEIPAAEL